MGKQQVIADGNPYLRSILHSYKSVERPDVQMLLDPFEETFHLPTFPLFSNGQVGMLGSQWSGTDRHFPWHNPHTQPYGVYPDTIGRFFSPVA